MSRPISDGNKIVSSEIYFSKTDVCPILMVHFQEMAQLKNNTGPFLLLRQFVIIRSISENFRGYQFVLQ